MSIIRTNQITDTAGTGSPSFPNNVNINNLSCAWAVKGTTNQSIPSGAQTQIQFPNEEVDTHSAFSSNIFTVPTGQAGLYLIGFNINWLASWSAQTINYLRQNGGAVASFMRYKDGNESGGGGSYLLNLSVGNTIDIAVFQASGSTRQLYTDGTNVTFWGYKIGVTS